MALQRRSLKRRLLFATVLILILLLAGGGRILLYLFEQHLERRAIAELQAQIADLINNARIDDSGRLTIPRNVMTGRFAIPYSGLYWQVDGENGPLDTSPSLWDTSLKLPTSRQASSVVEYDVKGPKNEALILVRQLVSRKTNDGWHIFHFAVGLDHGEVESAVGSFARELIFLLALLAVLLTAMVWVQVSYGLRPLRDLVEDVEAVARGQKKRIDVETPVEIETLVDQLNVLLDQQEVIMDRSRARAGGLAHSLKTPLSTIASHTRQLTHRGPGSVAWLIAQQVELMSRQIDRELIRTRVRGAILGARSANLVSPLAEDVVATLKRLPRGTDLEWMIAVTADEAVAIDTEDIAEILGNILDNSRKWARSQVRMLARPEGRTVALFFEDDGPGLPLEKARLIHERGFRHDDSIPGSGLGLTIVSDILAECGGEMAIYQSSLGGLGLKIVLPGTD